MSDDDEPSYLSVSCAQCGHPLPPGDQLDSEFPLCAACDG